MNYRDTLGRLRNPVPQPFSVLHDPVVKIDYRSLLIIVGDLLLTRC